MKKTYSNYVKRKAINLVNNGEKAVDVGKRLGISPKTIYCWVHDDPPDLLDTFFKLIKAGFSQKRKTLRNSLSSGLHISSTKVEGLLTQADIDPMRRAETLSIEEWSALSTRKRWQRWRSAGPAPGCAARGSASTWHGRLRPVAVDDGGTAG